MQAHTSVLSSATLVESSQALTEQYEELDIIGQGSFGVIRKIRRLADGKVLARKEIDYRKMSIREKEQLVSEVNILKDLKHPNIVDFIERVIDREKSIIYIIMEYCEYGDLATVIRNHKEQGVPIEEDYVWSILTQLVLALHECHYGTVEDPETKQRKPRPVLHRDLKPDNVFLMSKWSVKLGDFGLSRSLTNPRHAFAQTFVGTPYYMSPELISEASYGPKSDIWSLGCIVYELCALEPPFLAKTQTALATKIRQGIVPRLPPQYSSELSEVIKAMLRVEQSRRPSTKDLLDYRRIKMITMDLENQQIAAKNEADRLTIENVKRELLAKEQRLQHAQNVLENKDAELQARENWCEKREAELKQREELVHAKMLEMEAKWEELQTLEKRLQQQLQMQQQQQVVPVSSPKAPHATSTASVVSSTSRLSLSGRNSFPSPRPFAPMPRMGTPSAASSSAAVSLSTAPLSAPSTPSASLGTNNTSLNATKMNSRLKDGRKSHLPAARLTPAQPGVDQPTLPHGPDLSSTSVSSSSFSAAQPTASRDRLSFKWTMPTARQNDKSFTAINTSLTTMKPPTQQDAVAPQRPLSALNLGRQSEYTPLTSHTAPSATTSRAALIRMRAKSRSSTSLSSAISFSPHATATSSPDRTTATTTPSRPDNSSTPPANGQAVNGGTSDVSVSTPFSTLTSTLHGSSGKSSPPAGGGGTSSIAAVGSGGGDGDRHDQTNGGHPRSRGEHPRSASASSGTTTPIRFHPASLKSIANGGPRASWSGHVHGNDGIHDTVNITSNSTNKSMNTNGGGIGGGNVPHHDGQDSDDGMDWDADDLPSPFIKKTYMKA